MNELFTDTYLSCKIVKAFTMPFSLNSVFILFLNKVAYVFSIFFITCYVFIDIKSSERNVLS